MSPEKITLAAPSDHQALAETEAALRTLMRLGLVFEWEQQPDGSYCITADNDAVRELASLCFLIGQTKTASRPPH